MHSDVILQRIESQRDAAIGTARAIAGEPELGYRERRTAAKVERALRDLGLEDVRTGLAVTGVKATYDTGRPGPTVAIIGELDGLPISNHPDMWPETGAVHACGHNAQVGSVIAAAAGLLADGVRDALCGRLVFFAVPAEESVEVEWRLGLKEQGVIEFLGGKAELVRLGEFDDVDISMMLHTQATTENGLITTSETSNGHVIKFVRFVGRSSHAAGAPHRGINALKAAMLAMAAVDAQRETFQDADSVRIHPILTHGGDVVNAVPAEARLESFVRGKTVTAIDDANLKFDRAMRAGALALGATVEITTLPGYLPLQQDPLLLDTFRRAARIAVGEANVGHKGHVAAGTDMGDISQLMPAIHPSASGAAGTGHGADYRIEDWDQAVLNPGRALALTAFDLLSNNAEGARRVLGNHKALLSKEQYLAFLRRMDQQAGYEG